MRARLRDGLLVVAVAVLASCGLQPLPEPVPSVTDVQLPTLEVQR